MMASTAEDFIATVPHLVIIDEFSQSIISELSALIVDMFHPSEQKYNLKIQKVHNLMQLIALKFQSLHLYHTGEQDEMNSQLVNRDNHIKLLEDALQEISTNYRAVIERNNWEEGDCGSVGITSIIGSCFSSVSGDSDESDESSIHIHHLLVTASKQVDHQVEACTTPGTSLPGPAVEENVVRTTSRSSSRIPRLAHRVENSLANASIAISKSNEVRRRVSKLNRRIAEAQSLIRCKNQKPEQHQHDSSGIPIGIAHSRRKLIEPLLDSSSRKKAFAVDHRGNDRGRYY